MANKSKVKISNDVLADLGTDAAKWSEAFVQAFRALPDANIAAEQPAELFDPTPGGYLFGWVANMIEAGRSEGRASILKEGLNTKAELPVLKLPDVNAVEFSFSTVGDGLAKLWVDGQVRAVLGKPNTVIVMSDTDRYVLLREGELLETPPNRVDGE